MSPLNALLLCAKVYNDRALYKPDTIYSSFTPVVKSAVIGYRISGPLTLKILSLLTRFKFKNYPGKVFYKSLYDYSDKIIDRCNIVYFKGPKSFTGEDVAEIYIHGSPAIASHLEKSFSKINPIDFRQAKNGEFLYRAMINNKVSLKQSQAINNIIMSENLQEIDYSKKVLFNGDEESELYDLKESAINIYSKIITSIDFIEDESFDLDSIIKDIRLFFQKIQKIIKKNRTVIEQNNILNVMIIGDVNVGKSTIFNKIIGQERAIVTNIKGTTRDVVAENLLLENKIYRIYDTAGYRKKQGRIELLGYKKALLLSKEINHFLIVFNDALSKNDLNRIKKEFNIKNNFSLVLNKSDTHKKTKNNQYIYLNKSINRQKTIKLLKLQNIHHKYIKKSKEILTVNKNEINFLEKLLENGEFILNQQDLLIIQEIFRNIIDEFSENFGYINNEDMLDNVFSSFCIGK
ncbi:MAG: hypothetical protein CMI90_03020 [Pelagibacteraceae bacterium]|nr:hypothetical protein [Pelagibacteraceae bacterium]